MFNRSGFYHLVTVGGFISLFLVGCHRDQNPTITGQVKIDGSNTVYPITEAISDEFQRIWQDVRIQLGRSGSACGFRKLLEGDADVVDASSRLTDAEAQEATKAGMKYVELPIALDGITVVVNRKNKFTRELTTKELAEIWRTDSLVKRWSDIRKSWPKRPFHLYGLDKDSGTVEYFNKAILGNDQPAPRSDCSVKPNNSSIAEAIAKDPDGLGYVGFGYYRNNRNLFRDVAIDSGQGPMAPSIQSIMEKRYTPLSRVLYLYVSSRAAKRPEVVEFVRFYLKRAPEAVLSNDYVPLEEAEYQESVRAFETFRGQSDGQGT